MNYILVLIMLHNGGASMFNFSVKKDCEKVKKVIQEKINGHYTMYGPTSLVFCVAAVKLEEK